MPQARAPARPLLLFLTLTLVCGGAGAAVGVVTTSGRAGGLQARNTQDDRRRESLEILEEGPRRPASSLPDPPSEPPAHRLAALPAEQPPEQPIALDPIARFDADPRDEGLTAAAAAYEEALGKKAEADEIRRRHQAALALDNDTRELKLRQAIAADPDDDASLGKLVALLAQRQDLEGARSVYGSFVANRPTLRRRAAYGIWLYHNGFAEEAAAELGEAELDDPAVRGYLGLVLFDLGRPSLAERQIRRALSGGARLPLLRERLTQLEAEKAAAVRKKGRGR